MPKYPIVKGGENYFFIKAARDTSILPSGTVTVYSDIFATHGPLTKVALCSHLSPDKGLLAKEVDRDITFMMHELMNIHVEFHNPTEHMVLIERVEVFAKLKTEVR